MAFRTLMILVLAIAATTSTAFAVPVGAGTGVNTTGVYIEWQDGNVEEFELNFGSTTADSLTGGEVLLALDGLLTDLTLDYSGTGTESLFVNGITYQSNSNIGYDGGENWWHFWFKDPSGSWTLDWAIGASDKIVYNDYTTGWVYGRASAPVPEPATIALLALGTILLRKKKD